MMRIEKIRPSHLLKLEYTLFTLAPMIQQRNLLHSKEEPITVEKEHACYLCKAIN